MINKEGEKVTWTLGDNKPIDLNTSSTYFGQDLANAARRLVDSEVPWKDVKADLDDLVSQLSGEQAETARRVLQDFWK